MSVIPPLDYGKLKQENEERKRHGKVSYKLLGEVVNGKVANVSLGVTEVSLIRCFDTRKIFSYNTSYACASTARQKVFTRICYRGRP